MLANSNLLQLLVFRIKSSEQAVGANYAAPGRRLHTPPYICPPFLA
jgi:hypothetical protein